MLNNTKFVVIAAFLFSGGGRLAVKAEKGVYKADLVKVWEKAITFQNPHREGMLRCFRILP